MNVGIHPGHWFHHHEAEEHSEHGKLYLTLYNQAFWAIAILGTLIVGTVVLAAVFGKTPPSGFQYEPMYFP